MASLSCTEWKHYTLSYFKTNYYCHSCYLYNFYKSPFKLSDSDPPPGPRRFPGLWTLSARCALSLPPQEGTWPPRSRRVCWPGRTVLSALIRVASHKMHQGSAAMSAAHPSSHSKAATGNSWNRGEVSFRLDIRRIFTRVQPRLYWGSPTLSSRRTVSSPPEPHAESLTTD